MNHSSSRKTYGTVLIAGFLVLLSIGVAKVSIAHAASVSTALSYTNIQSYYNVGSTITINSVVKYNTLAKAQGSVMMTYPSSLLQYLSYSVAGASLPARNVWVDQGAGTIRFFLAEYVSGTAEYSPRSAGTTDVLLSVTFSAKATGNATLSYNSNRSLVGGSPWSTTTSITPSTLMIYPAACPSGQIGLPPNCTVPPPDVCPNLSGIQAAVPMGMIKDGSGNCVYPLPVDVCPNLAGNQASVPSGLIKNSSGQCIAPPVSAATSPPTTSTPLAVQSPTPTSQPQATADPTGTVEDISTQKTLTTATISWRVTKSVKSITFQYGDDTKGKAKVEPKLQDGRYTVTLANLSIYSPYTYVIDAIDQDDKTITFAGSFVTDGYPIEILVTQSNSPVVSQQVTMDGRNYVTNKGGKVSLFAAPGTHEATAVQGEVRYVTSITVREASSESGATPIKVQTFSFVLEAKKGAKTSSTNWIFYALSGIAAGALALGLVAWIIWYRRKGSNELTDSQTLLDVDARSVQPHEQTPPMAPISMQPQPFPEVVAPELPSTSEVLPTTDPITSTVSPAPLRPYLYKLKDPYILSADPGSSDTELPPSTAPNQTLVDGNEKDAAGETQENTVAQTGDEYSGELDISHDKSS